MAIWILFHLLILHLLAPGGNANPEGDVLYAWKVTLSDPNNVLQSWDPALVNPCTWFHVTCDIENRVTRLDLVNANLSGTLAPELGKLERLQYLHLGSNKLSGVIPMQLGNLTKLIILNLEHNQLSGVIPVVLGNLRYLTFMRLNSNKLSGTLPDTIIQLISHGSLQLLNVSDNHLAGTVRAANQREFLTTTVIQDPKAKK